MAIIGASRPYFAKYRKIGNTVQYYDGGVMGALVQFNIELEGNDNNNNDFYADNAVKETQRNKFSSGTLTVQTDDLRQEVSKAMLGVKEETLPSIPGVTESGVKELVYDDDINTPYLGIGVIQKKQVDDMIRWRAIVLRKIMFNVPTEAAETEGETINWQVPELSGTIMRDDTQKHMWKREATFETESAAAAYIRYMLNIPASNDATLAELQIGANALTPEFAAATTSYTAATTNATDVIAASPNDDEATVEIEFNDEEIENGSAVEWETGSNTVKFTVTAADGLTTKAYTVTVTKS